MHVWNWGTFAKLIKKNSDIRSLGRTLKCLKCKTEKEKSIALVPLNISNFNLSKIDELIRKPVDKQCIICRHPIFTLDKYENIIVFETETDIIPQKLSQVKAHFQLCGENYFFLAAIEYNNGHFTAHFKQKNVWETYDDLAKQVKILDNIDRFMNIFMVFYIKSFPNNAQK